MRSPAALLAAVGVVLLCTSGASAAIRKSSFGGLLSSRGLASSLPSVCRAKYPLLDGNGLPPPEADPSCGDGYESSDDGVAGTCYADCPNGWTIFQKNNTYCVEKCNSNLYYQDSNGLCIPKQACDTGKSLVVVSTTGTVKLETKKQCCPPCLGGWTPYGTTCSEPCPKDYVPEKDAKKAPTTCNKARNPKPYARKTKSRNCVDQRPSIQKPTKPRQSLPVQCEADGSYVANQDKCVPSCISGYDNIWNEATSQYECVMPDSGCGAGMVMCSHYCIATSVFSDPSSPTNPALPSTTSCSDLELVLDTIDGKDSSGNKCIQDCTLDSR